jgi:hypothetical protein
MGRGGCRGRRGRGLILKRGLWTSFLDGALWTILESCHVMLGVYMFGVWGRLVRTWDCGHAIGVRVPVCGKGVAIEGGEEV